MIPSMLVQARWMLTVMPAFGGAPCSPPSVCGALLAPSLTPPLQKAEALSYLWLWRPVPCNAMPMAADVWPRQEARPVQILLMPLRRCPKPRAENQRAHRCAVPLAPLEQACKNSRASGWSLDGSMHEGGACWSCRDAAHHAQ